MTLGASQLYNETQLRGLDKLGDVMVPTQAEFAAFSATGCRERIDTVMAPAHPSDQQAFGLLLWVLRWLPSFAIALLVKLVALGDRIPGKVGAPLRLLNVSLRGVVYSLYYSNYQREPAAVPYVHHVIGYQVSCPPVTDASKPSV